MIFEVRDFTHRNCDARKFWVFETSKQRKNGAGKMY